MLDVRPGIALVTRKTRLAGLLARWATKGAARFQIQQAKVREKVAGGAEPTADLLREAEEEFDLLEEEDDTYQQAVSQLKRDLELGLPVQVVDREYLPSFDFARFEVIVVAGQDGLVANTAKYAGAVPIVGVNPDPARFDGVLLPFQLNEARRAVQIVLKQHHRVRSVTLAEATLQDGQRLLAFNDLFIGAQSHVSARYQLTVGAVSASTVSAATVSVSTGSAGTAATGLAGVQARIARRSWTSARLSCLRSVTVGSAGSANETRGGTSREVEIIPPMNAARGRIIPRHNTLLAARRFRMAVLPDARGSPDARPSVRFPGRGDLIVNGSRELTGQEALDGEGIPRQFLGCCRLQQWLVRAQAFGLPPGAISGRAQRFRQALGVLPRCGRLDGPGDRRKPEEKAGRHEQSHSCQLPPSRGAFPASTQITQPVHHDTPPLSTRPRARRH